MEKVELTAKLEERALGVYDVTAELAGSKISYTGFHVERAKAIPIEEAKRIAEDIRKRISRERLSALCDSRRPSK